MPDLPCYEERTVSRHQPKSVGAAARRRVLANQGRLTMEQLWYESNGFDSD